MRALLVERNLNNIRKENEYITQKLIEVECKGSEKYPSTLDVSNWAFDRGLKAQPGTLWATRSPRQEKHQAVILRHSGPFARGWPVAICGVHPVWPMLSWVRRSPMRRRQLVSVLLMQAEAQSLLLTQPPHITGEHPTQALVPHFVLPSEVRCWRGVPGGSSWEKDTLCFPPFWKHRRSFLTVPSMKYSPWSSTSLPWQGTSRHCH